MNENIRLIVDNTKKVDDEQPGATCGIDHKPFLELDAEEVAFLASEILMDDVCNACRSAYQRDLVAFIQTTARAVRGAAWTATTLPDWMQTCASPITIAETLHHDDTLHDGVFVVADEVWYFAHRDEDGELPEAYNWAKNDVLTDQFIEVSHFIVDLATVATIWSRVSGFPLPGDLGNE